MALTKVAQDYRKLASQPIPIDGMNIVEQAMAGTVRGAAAPEYYNLADSILSASNAMSTAQNTVGSALSGDRALINAQSGDFDQQNKLASMAINRSKADLEYQQNLRSIANKITNAETSAANKAQKAADKNFKVNLKMRISNVVDPANAYRGIYKSLLEEEKNGTLTSAKEKAYKEILLEIDSKIGGLFEDSLKDTHEGAELNKLSRERTKNRLNILRREAFDLVNPKTLQEKSVLPNMIANVGNDYRKIIGWDQVGKF